MEKLYWEKYVDKELLNTPFGQISGIFLLTHQFQNITVLKFIFIKKTNMDIDL